MIMIQMMAQIHEEDLKNVPIRIKLPEKKEKVQNRQETPERKGRKKMKVQERKRGKTSIIDTSDHVHLLLWDVAVCLPARNIHGLPLKLKAVTAGKKTIRKNTPLPKPKRCANKDSPRKQAPWAIFEDKEDRQVNLNPPKKDFQQNVDTTRRRLLLANDVEQNPGPTTRVAETFISIEDWLSTLPEGQLHDTTDLLSCPINLRVELNIPFFNGESCDLPASGPYTVADHLQNMEKVRFVKEMVVPYLPDAGKAMGNDGPNIFVQQGLQYVGNSLVEMYKGKNLRKYYVLAGEDSLPVMVRLTFNKSKGTYIVTCDSGQCKAGKGHKKYVGNLLTSKVCKHLSVLKSQSEHWLDLLEDGVDAGDGDSSDCDMVTITPVANFTDDGDEVERLETFEVESSTGPSDSGGGGSSSSLHYFEEETGLWNFPAKSNHLPCEQGISKLMLNTCNRDTWSTPDCERDANGCVYGVELSPSVPEGNCDCGAGWLDENNQGKTLKERPVPLTVYTGTAPVKCMRAAHYYHDSREDQPNQCRLTALVHLSLWTSSYKES
ncbi:uncharacterized protein LOC128246295 [Mya arenaria]|uniref:uncharacterized protein LOC128246295 n=1 Tax=Mya arenaria TaxID=6604 RepID=UPI0022E672E6|nr:uncharacterized protein LOC128246295 [Mya arenaria]